MAFQALTDRLQGAITNVSGKGGQITEADLKQMMREVRLALLEADVNFGVVKTFVRRVNERALGSDVLEALSPAQQVVKIVHEELTKLMGSEKVDINFADKGPTIIMLCGLQGAGKTTTIGKLAKHLAEKEGKKNPLLVAGDVYRPAAIDQLKTLGDQLGYEVYSKGTDADPVDIAREAVELAHENNHDVVFIDTAGRLHVDEALMDELKKIKKVVNPDEILLTVDAMTGQDATNVAEAFNDELDITGVIITKLDGDTRGGAALSIREVTGKPIKFTGQGEKLEDLEPFYPERMAGRILGMGDMLTLIERAEAEYDEAQAEEMMEKMKEETFDFNDFLDQMDQVSKMGSLSDIVKMIPGLNQIPGLDQIDADGKSTGQVRAIIMSMTPEERANPDIISQSRRRRIARGSGNDLNAVNQLIKNFMETRSMVSQVSRGKTGRLEKMFNQLTGGGGGKKRGRGMPQASFKSEEDIKKERKDRRKQNKLRRLLRK